MYIWTEWSINNMMDGCNNKDKYVGMTEGRKI